MHNKNERIIEEYVKRFEQAYTNRSTYSQRLKEMAEIKLADITQTDVERVIRKFLYQWGRMGRILGRQEYAGWQKRLAEQIRSSSGKLRSFRQKDLADPKLQLGNFDSDIKKLYGSFKGIVGRTAATKALHLICPNFFPMWDNDIARAVRSEIQRKEEKSNTIEDFSSADYYRFVGQVLNFIKKYETVLSDLATQHKKGKLKILDEFLWWATHRPLSLFF